MKNNYPPKQTKQQKPKVEKENKKKKSASGINLNIIEADLKKSFDFYIKGTKFSGKTCEG